MGTNFTGVAYGFTKGDVVLDSSSVLSDVSADINSVSLGYGRVFALAGRQAGVTIAVPYAWGDVSGNVGDDRRSITRSGLGDPRLRFSAILLGGPALTRAALASRAGGPLLGVSLLVVPPLGQYDPARLINLGANRWAWRPEVGVSRPSGPWQFDVYAGVSLFGANDDFFGGQRRPQESVSSYQSRVIYTFRPGLWLAGDATHYTGGVSSIDDVIGRDLQNNTQLSLTLSSAPGRGYSIKLAASDGTTPRAGGDFRSAALA